MKKAPGLGRAQLKALGIIRRLGPAPPLEFAEEMWPGSPAWNQQPVMRRVAGLYLARLCHAGLLMKTDLGFMLSAKGHAVLDKASPAA